MCRMYVWMHSSSRPEASTQQPLIEETFPIQRIGQIVRLAKAVALLGIKPVFNGDALFAQCRHHRLGLLR